MPIIIDEMKNGWTERIEELEAENRRLREALRYIAFTTPGPTMKTHSEAAEQSLKEASHD